MGDYYYAPWQYELREQLGFTRVRPSVRVARSLRIPDPITGLVFAGAVFLAYAPLVQPGPPARTPLPNTLQLYQLGGGMIV